MSVRREVFEAPPDSSLMEDIGATSFEVAEAISELVANSLDARQSPDDKLAIAVQVSSDQISIVDDGKGMSEEILKEAVRLGVKMDAISGSTAGRKGMFGLGLKTAAASLGRMWWLHTRPSGGDEEHVVSFDLAKWRSQSGDKSFRWAIEMESGPHRTDGPLGSLRCGTAVVVTQLRESNPMAGSVLQKLGAAYKPDIEDGDVITVNGERAMPPAYDYFPDSRQDVELSIAGGHRITGWVALDKKTHNDDFFGINLYRKGQLIEPWNKDFFRVHLMSSRVIGEVHLDFADTNYFKRGFEKTTVEWKTAREAMREFLKPLVAASGQMARNKKDPMRVTRALQGLQAAMGHTSAISQDLHDDAETGGGGPTAKVEIELAPEMLYLPEPVRLVYTVGELDSELTPWDYVYDPNARELQAVMNSASRVFRENKDPALLGTLALADCVTSFLTHERGMDHRHAREVRNKWLYVTLGEK